MKLIDPNVIICVIAVCSIVSPIAVALINNRHQRKLHELDLAREREKGTLSYLQKVYETYVRSTNVRLYDISDEAARNYLESYAIALVYFPPDSREMLKAIDAAIESNDTDSASKQLVELSIWLSDLMKSFL